MRISYVRWALILAIATLCVVLLPLSARAAVAVVNTASVDDGGTASSNPSITYTPVGAQHRLIICMGENGKTVNATPAALTAYGTEPGPYGWCGYMNTTSTSPITLQWTLSANTSFRISAIELSGVGASAAGDVENAVTHSGGVTTQSVSATATGAGMLPVGIYMTITSSATVSANTYAGTGATQLRLDTANSEWGLVDNGAATGGAGSVAHSVTTNVATYSAFMLIVLVNSGTFPPSTSSDMLTGCCK